MDPFIPEAVSPFEAGDEVRLRRNFDSACGCLMNFLVESNERVWVVQLLDGQVQHVIENDLYLLKKAG